MICPNCSHLIKAGKRFCTNCGTPAPLKQCTTCQALNETDDNFCGDCGTRLSLLPMTAVLTAPLSLARVVSRPENERRFVTVLFADLVGFTTFSTQRDPEEVSNLVRHLVEIFEPEITNRGGIVDKYEGDAVLARFGAPIAHEDDAEQAMMAALALHRRIGELEARHHRPDGQPFRLRIGLNTGHVIAGTIDRDGRDYTILGDVVNTSQRFQTAAQPGETVVGELTYRLTRTVFDFESLGPLALKGKPRPALAYRVSGLKAEPGDGRGLGFNADVGPRAGEAPFVGGEEELAQLESAYELAKAGQGQLVLISGEKGIGKSRLVRHFLHSKQQHRLVVGRAFSFTAETAHALLSNLLIHMLGQHPSETRVHPQETRARLSDLALRCGLSDGYEDDLEIALLADALGLPDEDDTLSAMGQGERGHTLQRTVKELACGLSQTGAEKQPLVILLEDMHWADAPSTAAISLLAESLGHSPLLVVINSRPEWKPPQSWLQLPYFQTIELKGLELEERRHLLNHALRKANLTVPAQVEQEVIETTGGNPFFLEEMVAVLKEAMHTATIGENGELNLEVPATLHELLTARIDRLDSAARRVLQIGAVLGRRFPERLLWEVASRVLGETEASQLEHGLQTLLDQEMWLENRLAQELEYFFKHGLLQEVAYGIMLTERQRELHAQVGAALEKLYAGREEEVIGLLAYHYSRSDRTEKAIEYLTRAGDRAYSFDALPEARRYYEKAIKLEVDATLRTTLEARLAQFVS